MTQNQLAWLEHQETQRANRAKEAETNRANLAKEAETMRSNLQNEYLTNRGQYIKAMSDTKIPGLSFVTGSIMDVANSKVGSDLIGKSASASLPKVAAAGTTVVNVIKNKVQKAKAVVEAFKRVKEKEKKAKEEKTNG